jgi:hypothetical protein
MTTIGGTLQGVIVGVGVSVGSGVVVFVGVKVGVGVVVGVNVGTEIVAGSPITRDTRNISTIPSRLAVSRICGNHELIIGAIMG